MLDCSPRGSFFSVGLNLGEGMRTPGIPMPNFFFFLFVRLFVCWFIFLMNFRTCVICVRVPSGPVHGTNKRRGLFAYDE